MLSFNCKEETPAETANDMALVDNWEITKMTSEFQGATEIFTEHQLDSMGIIWEYKFNADLTLELSTNMEGPFLTLDGDWSTEINQLTMVVTGPNGTPGTIVYAYVINGNILTLNWTIQNGAKQEGEFTKQ